jgi:23S rRNA (guanosine2251-2'-O)-methyltransferase
MKIRTMRRTDGRGHRPSKGISGRPRFWGRHAVGAALANPARRAVKLWATRDAAARMELPSSLPVTFADGADLGRLVPQDAPHQGLVLEVEPLADLFLDELLGQEGDRPLLVLDQVTDPHNVGAILRSAAAFGALGIVTQDRHSPPESGALARAASGALETMPWVRVVNLARALEEMAAAGFWRIGLTGEAQRTLQEALGNAKVALVLGAEGEGLRPNTATHCDELARLPISSAIESLNVSNAAAIALYAVATRS